MDALWVVALILGALEGLTEFLPVSSTGHLILAGSLLGLNDDKSKVFDIAIQTGAIFAVVIVYWQRLRETVAQLPSQPQARRFVLNVAIAFLPAVVLGLLFGKAIKAHLFTPTVVASTFIIGGLITLDDLAASRGGRIAASEVCYAAEHILTALDAANGKGTLAEDKGLAAATAPLPKNSTIRGVIGTKSLFDLGQMILSFTGNPAQLKVPADVPPMAFGVTGDGGGTHIRFHAPTSVITAINNAVKQFQGGEGGDAEAPAEKKNEKPRF
jgi:hypothetical protein